MGCLEIIVPGYMVSSSIPPVLGDNGDLNIHGLVYNYSMICVHADIKRGKDPQIYTQVNVV